MTNTSSCLPQIHDEVEKNVALEPESNTTPNLRIKVEFKAEDKTSQYEQQIKTEFKEEILEVWPLKCETNEIDTCENSQNPDADSEACAGSFVLKSESTGDVIDCKNKQLECEYCGQCFNHEDCLAKHVYIHKTPYRCRTCDKAFTTKCFLGS